ncbi:unnamed protein product [Rodentolepis nana]|uniref:Mannosyl-oligosaccharide glucosidase n=1 Tax=Rodentolepis nana TaxID=102285 RepID=A0A158QHE2_RODNA|nr:unnamed protein product [Rodentolepis nana]
MSKSKFNEEKGRNRKLRSSNDKESVSKALINSKSIFQSGAERSRIRKPHKRGRSGFFRDIGSELFQRLLIGLTVFCCLLGVLYFGVQFNQASKRQRQFYTPINLPTVIGPNATAPDQNHELFWGTYRPNIFFGMSHRSPHSMLFGLAWVAFDGKSIAFRHQCTTDGDLKSYNWIEHDGRNYGIESVISGNHNITVAFVKRPNTPYGGDWTARISVSPVNKSLSMLPISVLFYAYLPDISRGRIQSYADKRELKRLRGFTHELGAFQVNFHAAKNRSHESTHLAGYCPREDAIVAALSSGLALRDEPSVFFTGRQEGLYGPNVPMPDVPANIWASEATLPGIRTEDTMPDKVDVLEVEFVSQASTSSDAVPLTGKEFDAALARHSKAFHENFAKKFPHDPKAFSDKQIEMSKITLSNMLGGIGYFYGTSLITASPLNNKSNAEPVILEYFPASLFTATPSRSKFPRGFLWDEGFHALLLGRWDVELALQSLGHWLDLLSAEGWIPREQILGWEARAVVPKEFIVQSTSVANPPALILAIEELLDRREAHMSKEEKAMFDRWMLLALPRLRAWFSWLYTTQAGPLPTSFRWRGRPLNNPSQLNPLTLASGLDDYPRSSHPSEIERHLDLRCWMAAFSRIISRLATHCETTLRVSSPNDPYLVPLKSLADEFQGIAAQLHDMQRLDELHWDESNGIYADYGLHSDKVALVQPPMDRAPVPGEPLPTKRRKVLEEPREQFVSSSVGYVTFFPLFLRVIPHNSPRLPQLLKRLADPKLLWTPHGLRSLAPTSPFYNRANTENDPPYWRGAIWINVNYMADEALQHYASHPDTPPEVAKEARKLRLNLSKSVVDTVIGEMNRTGVTWERYDDQTGRGLSGHPFNGWTALVSLFMTN